MQNSAWSVILKPATAALQCINERDDTKRTARASEIDTEEIPDVRNLVLPLLPASPDRRREQERAGNFSRMNELTENPELNLLRNMQNPILESESILVCMMPHE